MGRGFWGGAGSAAIPRQPGGWRAAGPEGGSRGCAVVTWAGRVSLISASFRPATFVVYILYHKLKFDDVEREVSPSKSPHQCPEEGTCGAQRASPSPVWGPLFGGKQSISLGSRIRLLSCLQMIFFKTKKHLDLATNEEDVFWLKRHTILQG